MKHRGQIAATGAVLLAALLGCSLLAQRYPAAKHGGNYMHNYYFPPGPSSTPWGAAWSPDGKWVAVGLSGSIWKIEVASGRAYELTHDDRYHALPDWSPDGRWIVYVADDGNSLQLMILDLDATSSHELTTGPDLFLDPVFSPDGTRLAYVSTQPAGHFNVFVRPISQGRWQGPAVAITSDNNFGRSRLYFGEWDMHLTPAWLPNGEELLLVSNRDAPLGSGNVLRVPARPDGIEQAQTVLREQTLYRARPRVSPDGKRFVYSSTSGTADQFNNLYVQPTVGGEPYKLTFFSHDAFHPVWSPDGESIAYLSNAGGLPQLALLETYGGRQRTIEVTERYWKRPVGVLAARVVEAESGQLTAARFHLTAGDGKFYAPSNSYARVSRAGDHVFHTPGEFQLTLPVGKTQLTAVKGFEWWPQTEEVVIEPSKVTHVTLRLAVMDDLGARGWYSGSTHVHMNYGGNLHNTLENLMLMSAAEDQDVVIEQIANKDNRILDYQHFVSGGGPHPLSSDDRILLVGQEYRPPFYGHVFLLGLRDHLISPYTTGYLGTAIESLYPSNTDIFAKARQQGATVGYVHAFGGDEDPLDGGLGGGKGYMVDAALGTTDAVEWSSAGWAGFFPWYATLNNGFRVTAVGGEDSISDLHRSKLVGSLRTYVFTGDRGLNLGAWLEGLRGGRAFVSSGPLIDFTVNGKGPGETVHLETNESEVNIEAWVRSITPLERLELVSNGQVVGSRQADANPREIRFSVSQPVTDSGWFHVRAWGAPEQRAPLDARYAQAFTNPVWVLVGNRPVRSQSAAKYSIRWIDKLQAMAEAWPGWRSQKEVAHVLAQFQRARAIYQERAEEAAALASN